MLFIQYVCVSGFLERRNKGRVEEKECSSSLEQLQDGQDDVVDVAEAGGLRLLGMVETSGPVDGDVRLLLVQLQRPS